MLKSSITVPLPGPKLVFPFIGQLVSIRSGPQALVVLATETPVAGLFVGVVVHNAGTGGSAPGTFNRFDAAAFEPFKGSVTISNAE